MSSHGVEMAWLGINRFKSLSCFCPQLCGTSGCLTFSKMLLFKIMWVKNRLLEFYEMGFKD